MDTIEKHQNFDLEEARCGLTRMRTKYGAETAIGRRCSGIMEMLKNEVPPAKIAKRVAELDRLVNDPQ